MQIELNRAPAGWGKVGIPEYVTATRTIGTCRVFIRRSGDEWQIAYEYVEDAGNWPDESGWKVDDQLQPPDVTLVRYVTGSGQDFQMLPALPDRPLVIRPDAPISVLPRNSGRFFVSIPIWYKFVLAHAKKPIDIAEIPSVRLSNTWFGDPASGELCYSLDAALNREPDESMVTSGAALCTFVVTNASQERLDFQRICVHVENLSLFTDSGPLWTNELNVEFKGADQVSSISIRPKPPDLLGNPQTIARPRVAANKNVLKRSFSALKQITGL